MFFLSPFLSSTDAKRKFLEAALKYLDILRSLKEGEVDDNELATFTEKAAICAILSPAGPQRQRIMTSILRLDSLSIVKTIVRDMLQRMNSGQFITIQDVNSFELCLTTHQKATDREGMTIMQKVMLEHNMLATSKVYKSISLDSLAKRLGVDTKKAELVAATMIKERRLAASIDQVDTILDFAPDQTSKKRALAIIPGKITTDTKSTTSSSTTTKTNIAHDFEKPIAVGIAFPSASTVSEFGANEAVGPRLQSWDTLLKEICINIKNAADTVTISSRQD
jgi:PCI domain